MSSNNSQSIGRQDELIRRDSNRTAGLSSKHSFGTGSQAGTGITSEDQIVDQFSLTSKEKKATQYLQQNVLTSASLQKDSASSYQVGLNMHSELCTTYNAEVKNSLRRCILTTKPDISFKEIAGCDYAKETINLTFVLPNQCPGLFTNKIRPWQSILLYGPPGVGKTMLT